MAEVCIASLPLPGEAADTARVLAALARAYPGCTLRPERRLTDHEPVLEVWWRRPEVEPRG